MVMDATARSECRRIRLVSVTIPPLRVIECSHEHEVTLRRHVMRVPLVSCRRFQGLQANVRIFRQAVWLRGLTYVRFQPPLEAGATEERTL